MNKTWQVQEAKARFGELLEASLKEGPQIVTKRGVEAAVLVPIAQWRKLEKRAEPTLKDLMLASGAKTESLTPPRQHQRQRVTRVFELEYMPL